MKLHNGFWLAMALTTSALATACGGGSTGTPNPVPTLTFLAPPNATAGGPAFTLTVNGTNFVSGAVVDWNGSDRTTTLVSATQVTAAINASDIAQAGKAQVIVINPMPGGGVSNPFTFTINPPGNPVPVLNMVMPSTATAGGPAFVLTVTGSNFISSSVVEWNGTPRPTTFGSATQLTAQITAADIATVGTAHVQVFNPVPGGGGSNSIALAINPAVSPTPNLAALIPSSATAGGSDFTLRVAGGNFIPSSIVEWNGSSRGTTFIDTSHLTAQITAADIATAGMATVTVLNPSPGGPSNALTFTISPAMNPAPSLASLVPSSASPGGGSFTLKVTGANFVSGATVEWNGSARSTSFLDASDLTAQITAADIANPGTATVTVVNPPPGGGPSTNSLTFTIGQAGNPAPNVSGLSPFRTPAGGPAFILTVAGANFISGSTVEWNGSSRMTVFVDSNHLTAQIPATDIATPGTAQVTVFTPAPGGGASSAFLFTISTPGQTAGVVQTASANTNGFPGNQDSFAPFLSATGEFIAFDSAATNLSPDSVNANHDIFLRDSCLGAGVPANCSPTTTRESSAPNGLLANAGSFGPSPISDDGRFVAFQSNAKNLVANDLTSTEEVFLHDTCTGQPPTCTPQTLQASLSSAGAQQTGGGSDHAAISASGRHVAFRSNANNLVTTTTGGWQQIYLRDTCLGSPSNCMPQTVLISADSSGNAANNNSDLPSVSADGRFVVFQSAATNLVSNLSSSIQHIYVRDTCLGSSVPTGCMPSTKLVSADSSGNAGNATSQFPVISRDGRFVVFSSVATNLVGNDNNGKSDVFLRDTCLGSTVPSGCMPSTTLVSLASDNTTQGNGDSFTNIGSALSSDDRFIVFGSNATNLLLPAGNPSRQVFVRDTCFGQPASCTPRLVMVSVDSTGAPVGGNAWTLSGDGHFVVFSSTPGANGVQQIFLVLTGF